MEEIRVTIIGAGVVGLAIATEVAKRVNDVVLIERHRKFGQETSSRNSEIIHAGIYYPPGSKKARFCVEGLHLLYDYCDRFEIPYSRLTKLIVASDESEIATLEDLRARARSNGQSELFLINQSEVRRLEPAVKGVAALYSPMTGIINSHALMERLLGQGEKAGLITAFGSEVSRIEPRGNGYDVHVGNEYSFHTKVIINAAGLMSDRVAEMAGLDIDALEYRLRFAKGSYFTYTKTSPVKRLIYPVPHHDLAGLGVHATLDLSGRLRFGPDVEFIDSIDYEVNPVKASAFYESACKLINGLERDGFAPDMAGVRPKIKGAGTKDFVIHHEVDKGLPGFINLIGIESPGLTSSLAIAKEVSGWTKEIIG